MENNKNTIPLWKIQNTEILSSYGKYTSMGITLHQQCQDITPPRDHKNIPVGNVRKKYHPFTEIQSTEILFLLFGNPENPENEENPEQS